MAEQVEINVENFVVHFEGMGNDTQRFHVISQMIKEMLEEQIQNQMLPIDKNFIAIDDLVIPVIPVSSSMNNYEIANTATSIILQSFNKKLD